MSARGRLAPWLAALSPNARASLCMMLAMAGFSINDALVKTLDGAVPGVQVMAVRGLFASALLVPLLWRQRLLGRMREALVPIVVLRASTELGGTLLFLAALPLLPFANISAILQALPLAVTLGAALVFGERVGWRRWLAIATGFGGVLLVIRPGSDGFEPASLLVVLVVGFAAARDLCARAMPPALPSSLASSASVVLATLGGLALCLAEGRWVPMDAAAWRTLALASLFLLLAQQFIVLAMRGGDIATTVPFRYTNLLWAIALGAWLFGERPDAWTLGGAAVIVATGLYTLYRETCPRRHPTVPPPAVRR